MTKAKVTKRALLSSALSLVLCFTMLLGTTFAWFTDSVTSANNVIQSGNLDIVMEYAVLKTDDTVEWKDVSGSSDILTGDLWEPGYVDVAYLRFKNVGSLALQYQLGVKINGEVTGKTSTGETIQLSDYIYYDVVDDKAPAFDNREDALGAVNSGAKISTPYSEKGTLLAGSDYQYCALVVYMPTTVGNEANHDGVNVPSIDLGINIMATQVAYEKDSFDENYDAGVKIVANNKEAQEALDNATSGTTIYMMPGVDYGTLYLRPVAGQANTVTDCDYLVYSTEMLRKVENLTIVGAPGATVDAIETVAGYVKDSGSTGYVVDIKNLVIDSVEFNDTYTNASHTYASPLFFDLSYINVDGLTVKNCELIGNNGLMNFVYFYGSGNPSNSTFETSAKNITITGNTVDGIARLCELRQAENVTISNNTIRNTVLHGMLLAVDGGTYSGNITIVDNTAEAINERFVRMAGAGNANVVIRDNVINNYMGEDPDYIKVTDSTGTVINENNTVTVMNKVSGTTSSADIIDMLTSGESIYVEGDIALTPTDQGKYITLNNDVTITGVPGAKVDFPVVTVLSGTGTLTVENVSMATPQEFCVSGDTTLIIESGEHTFGAFSATSNGKIVVNGGVLNCMGTYAGVMGISFAENGSLVVNDGLLNMYQPFNLNANRCDNAYIEINGGTIDLLGGIENLFVVRNIMDKDRTSGTLRGSKIRVNGGVFIAHYEVDSAGDATSFIRNGDAPADTNKVLVSNTFNSEAEYDCLVTGGTFYGSWQRADNQRYTNGNGGNSDGLFVENSIEGFVADGYQITGDPTNGYVVTKK